MKKKLLFFGAVLLTLVLTSGTFAFTYTSNSANLNVSMADGAWATYQVSPDQPDWNSILPESGSASEILVPSAPGDYTDVLVQSPDSGEHWDKVADQPADDGATYISTYGSSSWQGDAYQLSDFTGRSGSDNITGVTVYVRYTAAGSWTARAIAEMVINGTTYSGPTESKSGTGYVTVSWQNETNPDTGEAWTREDLNNLQVGVALKGPANGRAAYCTQVYVEVNYSYTGNTQGEVPQGNLFKVTPDPEYTGDLLVKIYLMNTVDLIKAYKYLNMMVYTTHSQEAGETPGYKVLSLENGVIEFTILGGSAENYFVSVNGGSYSFISGDPSGWGAGYTITPEFYCEVTQR